jgi:subtilisin family serine protease
MRKKIIGIFVCMLLFATALPAVGAINKTINQEIKQIEDTQNKEFIPGEFIVKLKDVSTSNLSIANLNKKNSVRSINKVFKNPENSKLDNIYKLSVSEDSDIFAIVDEYSSNLLVEYAEPNYIIQSFSIAGASPKSVPLYPHESSSKTNTNDPDFCKQWSLENTGQMKGTPDTDIDAPEAWGIEIGDPAVVIAIIDSGIDYYHPDLSDNIWINEDEIPNNGIDDDGNGYIDDIKGWNFIQNNNNPLDDQGHGTFCSGIAAARGNNDIGIAGVCWNCKIMPVKTLNKKGSGTWSAVAQGIKYAADNNADVISMSFGAYDSSDLLKDAVDYAYNKNIVLVAAAGNDGISDKWYPAGYDNVISVAATDNNDKRMDCRVPILMRLRSNYGNWVDVAAPGENVYSTMPTYYVTFNLIGLKRNYDYFSGSSFAVPHVAGLVALILSKNHSLSPIDVKSLICENLDPYDSEYYLGNGRINAFKVLNENILPPDSPETPYGPTYGKIREICNYITNTIDPQGDQVYYMWDWGDEVSNWEGPYNSGEKVITAHTWNRKGNYEIKVKAKNIGGAESNWSDTLPIYMSKNKVINRPLLQFLNSYSHIFQLLRQLLDL